MAIYVENKEDPTSAYPVQASDSMPLGRVEPLIAPQQLRDRFLFGIPLYSAHKDPVTGRRAAMTDTMLQDYIEGAVSKVEQDAKIDVFPVQHHERVEFDWLHFKAFMRIKVKHVPVRSVEELAVETANGTKLYDCPREWIERGGLPEGVIHLIPLAIGMPGFQGAPVAAGGAWFLNTLGGFGGHSNIPYYWTVKYTTGFDDAKIPRIVNDLIGIEAALNVLGMLAATNRETSKSMGLDGISQGVGTPGPQVYALRIQELQQQYQMRLGKVQNLFGKKFIIGDV